MEVRYMPDDRSYERMSTNELRAAFVLDTLFTPGALAMTYCDADRLIVGGAVPAKKPLALLASKKEMAAEFFAERREIGIVNLAGEGVIVADKTEYPLQPHDMLYLGRGTKDIQFRSVKAREPAYFYFASFPAHTSHPHARIAAADAEHAQLGSAEAANKRVINRYIHTGGIQSCQLVMGMTELETGSVWNTMPPHTHMRRMEAYLYYGLGPDDIVVHLMGRPEATRSLILRNLQVVIAPSWSIHCAAATTNYRFVWAMGGENQEFGDMDAVRMQDLR